MCHSITTRQLVSRSDRTFIFFFQAEDGIRDYAQFSRTLGTLMENGIPLLRSLDLVTEIAGNRFLERKLVEVRRAVIDGATLSAALQEQRLFPDFLTDMMAVGEQTGHFAETMQAIADV